MSSDTEYRQIETTEDEYVILNALHSAGDRFVSGSLLGEQLGVSRPAIHGKLEKLREKGFEIEAIRNKGYRLVKEPDVLFPGLVRYYGAQIGQSFELLYFPVIDSTNSEAERQLSYGRKGPFAIVSSCQTKGRGRLGRDWHSASAENLYLSVVFEPNIPHNNYSISHSGQAYIFAAPCRRLSQRLLLKLNGRTTYIVMAASLQAC